MWGGEKRGWFLVVGFNYPSHGQAHGLRESESDLFSFFPATV